LITLRGHLGEVIAANFSPDGKRIVTGSIDKTSRVWSVEAPSQAAVLLKGWTDESEHYKKGDPDIQSVELSNDSSMIMARDDDHVYLLETKTGKQIRAFNHSGKSVVSPDNSTISITEDGSVYVFDIATGSLLLTAKVPNTKLLGARFFHNSQMLLTFSDQEFQVWDLQSKTLRRNVRSISSNQPRVISDVILSDDNRSLFALVGEQDTHSSRVVALRQDIMESSSAEVFELPVDLGGDVGWEDFAISPDGNRLLIAFSDHKIRVWDSKTRKYQKEVALELPDIDFLEPAPFSERGESIMGQDDLGNVHLFDTETGYRIDTIYTKIDNLRSVSQRNGLGVLIDRDTNGKYDNVWRIVVIPMFVQQATAIARVETMAPRCLTESQVTQYSAEGKEPKWCEAKWPVCLINTDTEKTCR
jgi:WD40 repeat protein